MDQKNLFKRFMLVLIITVFGFILMDTAATAGEEPKESTEKTGKSASSPDHEAMMEKYKEYSTPNENHKVLDTLVGDWDYALKWWVAPGAEPEVSTGTSTIKWIMGGRFIKHKAEGTSMGQPFEGMGITRYDNEKKQDQTVWIDNMGTGIVKGGGNYDPTRKTISEEGTFSCPEEGDKLYRGVTTIKDNENFTYELYMNAPDGKEFRAMEITYTRKK